VTKDDLAAPSDALRGLSIQEPDEEVRLAVARCLLVLLTRCVATKSTVLLRRHAPGLVIGSVALARDPAPAICEAGCSLVVALSRCPLRDQVVAFAQGVAKALCPPLLGRKASVIRSCLRAISAVVMLEDPYKRKGAGTEAIQDMVGYRDENVVPLRAFYGNDREINYFGSLISNDSGQVRYAFVRVIASWMWGLPDRWDHVARLLPFLLAGLCDDDPAVRRVAGDAWRSIGRRHEVEEQGRLLEKVQYGVDDGLDPEEVKEDGLFPTGDEVGEAATQETDGPYSLDELEGLGQDSPGNPSSLSLETREQAGAYSSASVSSATVGSIAAPARSWLGDAGPLPFPLDGSASSDADGTLGNTVSGNTSYGGDAKEDDRSAVAGARGIRGRPSLGCRLLLKAHAPRFAKPLLAELGEWTGRARPAAARMLVLLASHWERLLTERAHEMIRVCLALLDGTPAAAPPLPWPMDPMQPMSFPESIAVLDGQGTASPATASTRTDQPRSTTTLRDATAAAAAAAARAAITATRSGSVAGAAEENGEDRAQGTVWSLSAAAPPAGALAMRIPGEGSVSGSAESLALLLGRSVVFPALLALMGPWLRGVAEDEDDGRDGTKAEESKVRPDRTGALECDAHGEAPDGVELVEAPARSGDSKLLPLANPTERSPKVRVLLPSGASSGRSLGRMLRVLALACSQARPRALRRAALSLSTCLGSTYLRETCLGSALVGAAPLILSGTSVDAGEKRLAAAAAAGMLLFVPHALSPIDDGIDSGIVLPCIAAGAGTAAPLLLPAERPGASVTMALTMTAQSVVTGAPGSRARRLYVVPLLSLVVPRRPFAFSGAGDGASQKSRWVQAAAAILGRASARVRCGTKEGDAALFDDGVQARVFPAAVSPRIVRNLLPVLLGLGEQGRVMAQAGAAQRALRPDVVGGWSQLVPVRTTSSCEDAAAAAEASKNADAVADVDADALLLAGRKWWSLRGAWDRWGLEVDGARIAATAETVAARAGSVACVTTPSVSTASGPGFEVATTLSAAADSVLASLALATSSPRRQDCDSVAVSAIAVARAAPDIAESILAAADAEALGAVATGGDPAFGLHSSSASGLVRWVCTAAALRSGLDPVSDEEVRGAVLACARPVREGLEAAMSRLSASGAALRNLGSPIATSASAEFQRAAVSLGACAGRCIALLRAAQCLELGAQGEVAALIESAAGLASAATAACDECQLPPSVAAITALASEEAARYLAAVQ